MVNPWALVQDQDGRMVRWEMMEMIRGKVGQGRGGTRGAWGLFTFVDGVSVGIGLEFEESSILERERERDADLYRYNILVPFLV